MLVLKNICKEYRTGDTVTKALDHVSITFRDAEFAAVLGPSGSGKTTLLNIIGGLDRYDSGDLIINGTSTRKFRDRDFDDYRNHTIGFIFQSYNLIGHQSVLSNVELALTISGITGKERKRRAQEALIKVGLKDHMNKRPNQLSGGQMQRVAIARALVNDPDIVLADEPTGALDTKTSLQVMDLLKEVAKDRVVIMVTHNPDLARQYATRIVTIKDGRIIGDSDPVADTEKPVRSGGKFKRTCMNFLTAVSLSFNNLRTKKVRTFMVSLAGSIGIIGIALLLAIEEGLGSYIEAQESQALSAYPLEIYANGIDLSSLIDQGNAMVQSTTESQRDSFSLSSVIGLSEKDQQQALEEIKVNRLAQRFLSGVNANDLASLKQYLDSDASDIHEYASSIEYSYGVQPLIYKIDDSGSAVAVNPSSILEGVFSDSLNLSGLLGNTVSEVAFHALPSDASVYENDYVLEAGHWPENSHEMVLVLTPDGSISDLILYEMGIWDSAQLSQMIQSFTSSDSTALMNIVQQLTGTEEVTAGENDSAQEPDSYSCDDFIGLTYKLVHTSDCFTYDEELGLWTDLSEDSSYMSQLAQSGEDLTIVGIVMAEENSGLLVPGVYYPRELLYELIQEEENSDPVQAQLASPDTDIFTGQSFNSESGTDVDFGRYFSVDHDAVADAFTVNTDGIDEESISSLFDPAVENIMALVNESAREAIMDQLDQVSMDDLLDYDTLAASMPSLTEEDIQSLVDAVSFTPSEDSLTEAVQNLTTGYLTYMQNQGVDFSEEIQKEADLFTQYLQSEETQTFLTGQVQALMQKIGVSDLTMPTQEEIQQTLTNEITAYLAWVDEVSQDSSSSLDPEDPAVLQMYFASDQGQARLEALVEAYTPQVSEITQEDMEAILQALLENWSTYYKENGTGLWLNEDTLKQTFLDYLGTEEAKNLLVQSVMDNVDPSSVHNAVMNLIDQKLAGAEENIRQSVAEEVETAVNEGIRNISDTVIQTAEEAAPSEISSAIEQAADYINTHTGDFFTVDQEAFRNAIRIDLNAEQMQALLNSLLSQNQSTLSSNLAKLGYCDLDSPTQVSIYPRTFADKGRINDVLEAYNDQMRAQDEDSKVIVYTDVVATMMQSVTDIITTVSEVLIGFVAISLVVSSIMIGVITYISVLERRKEIGVLRALGASKHNIREVFNAETMMTGLMSGLMGIGFTCLLIPLADYLIWRHTGQLIHVWLTLPTALGLILLSTVLTTFAGLIPSTRAARSDPVEALRTE